MARRTSSDAGLVDQFIGTAYDNVLLVAENIDDLVALSNDVAFTAYLGAFPEPPVLQPGGTNLLSGDFYLNTTDNSVYYYDATDSIWLRIDASLAQEASVTAVNAAASSQESADAAAADANQVSIDAAQTGLDRQQTTADAAATAADRVQTNTDVLATNALAVQVTADTAAAAQSASDAAQSEAYAAASAASATQNESNAAASALTATSAANTAATDAVTAASSQLQGYSDSASNSAVAALASENAASASETSATASETSATISATSASTSATNASNSENAAASSAASAATDAASIASSVSTAAASASTAQASEAAASVSASAAATSETNAASSESSASSSETTATTAAANALSSETAAALSAQQAANSVSGATSGVIPLGPWDASGGTFPAQPTNLSYVHAYHVEVGGTMTTGGISGQAALTVAANDVLYSTVNTGIWYKIIGAAVASFNPNENQTINGDWEFTQDLEVSATVIATSLSGDGSAVSNVDAATLDGVDSTGFATASQGALADTATQPDANLTISGEWNLSNPANTIYGDGSNLSGLPTPDLTPYALISSVPTDNNELANGAGYITSADGGNAATVGGHTVDTDVPSGAVFTDTVYDDTTITATLTGTEVAIGAGTRSNQGSQAVAVGDSSGDANQGIQAVAVGCSAGYNDQGTKSVALGYYAGYDDQGPNAIAIGENAGKVSQGDYSIAIGTGAGVNTQGDNGIIISSDTVEVSDGSAGHIHIETPLATLNFTQTYKWEFTGGKVTASEFVGDITAGTISLSPELTGSLTIDFANGDFQVLTPTASGEIVLTPPVSGSQTVTVKIVNTGYTLTWPAGTKFSKGTTLVPTVNGVDYVGILYDSSDSTFLVLPIAQEVA